MTARSRSAHYARPAQNVPRSPSPRLPARSQPKRDPYLATSAAADDGCPGEESMSSHPVQRDAIREFVARTRAEQGLPPTIEDPTALDKIAAVFRLVKDSTAGQDAG
jgi:hypothetical protein